MNENKLAKQNYFVNSNFIRTFSDKTISDIADIVKIPVYILEYAKTDNLFVTDKIADKLTNALAVLNINERYGGIAVAVTCVVMVVYGATIGWRNLQVKHVHLTFSQLPPAFDGYRIVHFSDFHAVHGPMNTTFALPSLSFIFFATVAMGESEEETFWARTGN